MTFYAARQHRIRRPTQGSGGRSLSLGQTLLTFDPLLTLLPCLGTGEKGPGRISQMGAVVKPALYRPDLVRLFADRTSPYEAAVGIQAVRASSQNELDPSWRTAI